MSSPIPSIQSRTTSPGVAAINLTRMISRLADTLLNPESTADSKLIRSTYERQKLVINIDYARNLLVQLQQDALQIKAQSKKQDIQLDLVRKRDALDQLSERLKELNQLGDELASDDERSEEGEIFWKEDVPTDENVTADNHKETTFHPSNPELPLPEPSKSLLPDQERTSESAKQPLTTNPSTSSVVESSQLRARNVRAELFEGRAAATTGISTATADAVLEQNRTEQESLTESLLEMAKQLRESSTAFVTSLDEEKSILQRASDRLDKNELSMEAAQKRMGYLRSVSEGRGWMGRMLMYAYIAGLMVVALVIVFVLPKLRFSPNF